MFQAFGGRHWRDIDDVSEPLFTLCLIFIASFFKVLLGDFFKNKLFSLFINSPRIGKNEGGSVNSINYISTLILMPCSWHFNTGIFIGNFLL